MRVRRRGLRVLGLVLAALAAGAAIAYADTVNGDGDVLKSGNNVSYTVAAGFTERCTDRGAPVAGVATVKYNGAGIHFDPGATMTVTVTPDAAGAAAGITASGGTVTVPDPWATVDQTFTRGLTTTVPLTVPNGTYTMTVEASAAAHDAHGLPLVHHTTDTYLVSVTCPNSAPSIAWASSPASADEGQTKDYAFSIADADSTSWTYAAGSPDCGAHGTLAGTPSIDSTARTGSFSCSFPNGPASSTVSVQVGDGTGTSSTLSQAVDVANVAPSASFTDAPSTAIEGQAKTYAFTVADPGAADTFAPAAGTPDCGAHGALVPGSLTLSGNHGSQTGTFACSFAHGPSTTTVKIAFTDSDGSTGAPAAADVAIADAPLTAGALSLGDGVEGGAPETLSFGFTDANPASTAADYTATIAWGDGATSSGLLSAAPGGGFTVAGSHVYADEGSYAVAVSVADDGGSSTTAGGTAHVADAPLTAGSATVGDGVEGITASTLSFAFTDANPGATAADFAATIGWGDGSSTVGTVTAAPGGGFSVGGTHLYALQGTYPVSVAVLDDGGSSTSAAVTAVVADAPLGAGALTITDGVAGVTASQLTFAFSDANPGATPTQTAAIAWGDGTTTPGVVAAAAGGGFAVTGSHLYAHAGVFHVTVTVTGDGGSTTVGTGDAKVTGAPITAGALTLTTGVEGVTATQLSFGFADANPSASAADFTATITWGDGATSAATVAVAAGGGFVARGTHTYTEEGRYAVSVAVTDGSVSTTATGRAAVEDAPLSASAPALSPSTRLFIGSTATFTDANPSARLSDFTARIDWGDGSSTFGLVTRTSKGFAVHGIHLYFRTGYKTVTTTILDDGGSSAHASTQLLVFAFAHGGAFVIGDRSATGSVTFFGSQWSKRNALSGGPAPSSFKGFAANPSTPVCHGTWSTHPGEDDALDGDDLPDYMAVVVTSRVTKSGKNITGDTADLVIVRTDDVHGHDAVGTGTVVASVPGC